MPEGVALNLRLGQIAVKHPGCWAAGVTTKFPNLILEGFILKPFIPHHYETVTVIRLKQGKFDPELTEDILGYINSHRVGAYKTVEASETLVESDRLLVCRLKCNDHRGRAQSEAVVKLISIFGGIVEPDVGNVADGGTEYVNAFFPDGSSWNICKEVLKRVYGANFLEDESKLHDRPGLQDDPPFLAEALLDHKVRFETHRKIVDLYLKQGRPDQTDEESWQKDIFIKLAETAQNLPEYKQSIAFVAKLMFGMKIDP